LLEKNPRARYRTSEAALRALDGRRIGMTRRALRRLAAAAALVVLSSSAVAWWRASVDRDIDRVEVVNNVVVARDSEGRQLWSLEKPGLVPEVAVADFAGGPELEVAVGWAPTGSMSSPDTAIDLELHAADGELLRSTDIAKVGTQMFQDQADAWSLRPFGVANLVGSGPELVWAVVDPRSYPSMVGVTSFRSTKDKKLLVLANSGHIQNMTVVDLDGDGLEEIVALAYNNPLGFQRTLIIAGGTSRTTGEPCGGLYSPDINAFRQARSDQVTGCLCFTPLGSNVFIVDPPTFRDGAIELIVDGVVRHFDTWGNPESSPLYGSGGKARESFWNDLAARCARMRLATAVDPPFTIDQLRETHPRVMAEGPAEVAAILLSAQALASGGHRENAVALLRDGVERFPDERDLHLRLGEQLLIAGERAEGRRWLQASITIASTGRAHTDLSHMLILDAARSGDDASYDETRRFLDNLTVSLEHETLGFLDMAWLFFRGRWTDPQLLAADVGWVHLWVRFLRGWALLESGGESEQVMVTIRELADFSESRNLAHLLEARVRLAEGDSSAALRLADGARKKLMTECRRSYQACVWLPLSEWLVGEALAAGGGRAAEAEAMLAQAAEHAPNTWIATPLTR
jgi:hypothetical protein